MFDLPRAIGALIWRVGLVAPLTPESSVRRLITKTTQLCVLLPAIAVAGSAVAGTINGSWDSKYARYVKTQPFAGTQTSTWSDAAWAGDRMYKQLVIWNTSTTQISGIQVSLTPLSSGTTTIPNSITTPASGPSVYSGIRVRLESYAIGDQSFSSSDNCASYPATKDPYPGSGKLGSQARPATYIAEVLSESSSLTPTSIPALQKVDPIKFWVTVDVPANTAPGTYNGAIAISATGAPTVNFPITMIVGSKTLAPVANWSFNVDIWQFPYALSNMTNWQGPTQVSRYSSAFYNELKPFYTHLLDLGQKAMNVPIKDGAIAINDKQTMVNWVYNSATGTWAFDFANFNNYVQTLTSWGFTGPIQAMSLFGWNDWRYVSNHVGPTTIGFYDSSNYNWTTHDAPSASPNSPLIVTPGDPTTPQSFASGYNPPNFVSIWASTMANAAPHTFSNVWSAFLTAFRANLMDPSKLPIPAGKPSTYWQDRVVLYMDETGPNTAYSTVTNPVQPGGMDAIVALIQANNPVGQSPWKIGLTGRGQNAFTTAALNTYSQGFFAYDKRTMDANGNIVTGQAPGSVSTIYASCSTAQPSHYITPQSNLSEMAWLPWYAFNKGLNGYLFWAYDYWANPNPINMQDGLATAGDRELVYRSTNDAATTRPRSSIRSELLRDAFQDMQKLIQLGPNLSLNYPSVYTALRAFVDAYDPVSNSYLFPAGTNATTLVQNGQDALKQAALYGP